MSTISKSIMALSVIGPLFFLSGCASYSPVPDDNRLSSGYKDKKLGENNYWVFFQGAAYDTSTSVLKLWQKRASELCSGKGFVGTPVEGFTSYTYSAGAYGVHPAKLVNFRGEITCNS